MIRFGMQFPPGELSDVSSAGFATARRCSPLLAFKITHHYLGTADPVKPSEEPAAADAPIASAQVPAEAKAEPQA